MKKNRVEKMIDLIVEEFGKSTFPDDYILHQIICEGLVSVIKYYAMQSMVDREGCDIQYDREQAERLIKLLKDVKDAYYVWEN